MHAELVALARSLRGRPLDRPDAVLDALWPHLWPLWLSTATLAPLVCLALSLTRSSLLDSDPDRSARSAIERSERGVARRARLGGEPRAELDGAAFLGYRLRGDPLLPTRRGRVYLPLSRLGHHLLVVGATGSGKTETVLRLVDSVARSSDWRIVFLDGKGDRETAERFCALAAASGRRVWRFPEAAYDGWRGDGAEIAGRLLQLVDFAESGGGTYYRDLAVNAIRLACGGTAGPPRSSVELLRRLRGAALAELHPSGSLEAAEVAGLNRGQLDGIRARYAAFFATVGKALDGRVAFEEVDSAYFLLDGLRLKHEAGYLARFLVEEFTQWAAGRKPRPERVLLVVDEFSAIATAGRGLVDVVERTRAFGVAAVLCPQVAEGMGSFEAAARLIGSAQTIVLHAMANPERFVEAAGGRRIALTSRQLDGDAPTGIGSTRPDREQRIDPDEVRRLRPGQCFAIGSGLALKLQVAPTPRLPERSGTLRPG
jgi:Helicase HerA, central domain